MNVFGEAFGAVSSENLELVERVKVALDVPEFDASISIGLVGCGWIGGLQLQAYRKMGLNVVALFDRHPERMLAHAETNYPDAARYDSIEEFLAHPGLSVVDVTTHVDSRPEIILQCIAAGKNVLSQKPFVESVEVGERMVTAARDAGVLLASNQNGRWAPHLGAMLSLVKAGLIGTVESADFQVYWPHDEVVEDKPLFAEMQDLILFDFGAHWFDILGQLAPDVELEVRAKTGRSMGQVIEAPTQASALVTGEGFMGSVLYRASERFAEIGGYRVSGTHGVITQLGLSLGGDSVTLHTADGVATIQTSDDWFTHGLAGTMRELLAALTEPRLPSHNGLTALRGLELCFAALEAARTGHPIVAGNSRARQSSV